MEVVVDVDGMVCDACSKAVVDQLKSTDGVVAQLATIKQTAASRLMPGSPILKRSSPLGRVSFPVQKVEHSEPPAGPEVAPVRAIPNCVLRPVSSVSGAADS